MHHILTLYSVQIITVFTGFQLYHQPAYILFIYTINSCIYALFIQELNIFLTTLILEVFVVGLQLQLYSLVSWLSIHAASFSARKS